MFCYRTVNILWKNTMPELMHLIKIIFCQEAVFKIILKLIHEKNFFCIVKYVS